MNGPRPSARNARSSSEMDTFQSFRFEAGQNPIAFAGEPNAVLPISMGGA